MVTRDPAARSRAAGAMPVTRDPAARSRAAGAMPAGGRALVAGICSNKKRTSAGAVSARCAVEKDDAPGGRERLRARAAVITESAKRRRDRRDSIKWKGEEPPWLHPGGPPELQRLACPPEAAPPHHFRLRPVKPILGALHCHGERVMELKSTDYSVRQVRSCSAPRSRASGSGAARAAGDTASVLTSAGGFRASASKAPSRRPRRRCPG